MPENIDTNARRVNLNVAELRTISAALEALIEYDPSSPATALKARLDEVVAEESDPAWRFMRDAYRDAVERKDGEIEIDDDAEVSMGDDSGAYVMVWTWVNDEDAGILHPTPLPDVDMAVRNV